MEKYIPIPKITLQKTNTFLKKRIAISVPMGQIVPLPKFKDQGGGVFFRYQRIAERHLMGTRSHPQCGLFFEGPRF
jgi:hypothetical protein